MKLNTPNQLTFIRIILTPLFVYLMINSGTLSNLIAAFVFFIAAFTDWYDGYIARRLSQTSKFGQFMDPLADKILVLSALAVFAYLDYAFLWMILIIIIRDVLITFLRSYAIFTGAPIITSTFAKWKTFLQMAFVMILLIYINIPNVPDVRINQVQNPWFQWTTITLLIVVILTIISGIHYLVVNRSHMINLFRRDASLLSRAND